MKPPFLQLLSHPWLLISLQPHIEPFSACYWYFLLHILKIQLFLTNSTLSKLSNLLSELSARAFKWFPQGLFTYFTFFLEMMFPQFACSSIPNCIQVSVHISLIVMTICDTIYKLTIPFLSFSIPLLHLMILMVLITTTHSCYIFTGLLYVFSSRT